MPTTVWQRLGLVLSVFLLISLTLVITIQRASKDFFEANQNYLDRQNLVGDLRRVLSLAQDLETGPRGYVITGDTAYLEPYDRAQHSIASIFTKLSAQAKDFPAIATHLDTVSVLLQRRLAVVDTTIAAGKRGDFRGAVARIRSGTGKRLMDAIRRQLAEAETTAARNLVDARSIAEAQRRQMVMSVILASIAAVLLALVAGAIVQRELASRRAERDALAGKVMQTSSELAAHEEHFRAIMSASPVAVVGTDLEGRVTFWSPGAERLFGYTAAETIGQRPAIIPPELLGESNDFFLSTLSGKPVVGKVTTRLHKSGAGRNVTVSTDTVRDIDGRIIGVVGALIDTTSQHKLEEQLRQSQKQEALGRLAGGIAHDFNNLLTAILGFTDRVTERLPANERRREDLREITVSAERAAALTRQLLSYSRPRPINPQVLDVTSVVRHMELMLRRVVEERIDLKFVTSPDAGRIRADSHQLEQILLNLCINARDAMPHGGRLTVEVAPAELDTTFASEHPGLSEGHYTLLSVSDTGTGMDEVTRQRIFEPFFTTKGEGRGTGLGLATVYGIVAAANGGILVYSEPGRGSSFKVYLPTVDAPVASPDPVRSETVEVGTGTILLVEDNAQVRALTNAILEDAGFSVNAFSSAEQALDRATRGAISPDLLLTDMVLGGISGLELSRLLRRRFPNLGVIFMSGYTEETAEIADAMSDPNVRFLEKPFRRAALLAMISSTLAETSGQPGRIIS